MRDGRRQLLPTSLLVFVGGLGIVSLAGGMYLDWAQESFLEQHPITANLISGLIGFCSVTVLVGVSFTFIAERSVRRSYEAPVVQAVGRHIAEAQWVWYPSSSIRDYYLSLAQLRVTAADIDRFASYLLQTLAPDNEDVLNLYEQTLKLLPRVRLYVEDYLVRRDDQAAVEELGRREAKIREVGDAAAARAQQHSTSVVPDLQRELVSMYKYLATVMGTFKTI